MGQGWFAFAWWFGVRMSRPHLPTKKVQVYM